MEEAHHLRQGLITDSSGQDSLSSQRRRSGPSPPRRGGGGGHTLRGEAASPSHIAGEWPSQDVTPRLLDAKVQLLIYKCCLPRNQPGFDRVGSLWANAAYRGLSRSTGDSLHSTKPTDVLESRNRRSRHRPTDKAALSRTMGSKTVHRSSPPPTSQRYTRITAGHREGCTLKEALLSTTPPPVQGWGSRMDFLSSRHLLAPRGEGGILASCCVSAPTAG